LINEVVVKYMRFGEGYFVKNGKKTDEVNNIWCAIDPLRELYGLTPAAEFGPRRLKAVRQHMIDHRDLCRGVINGRIKSCSTPG
jgi:hypothetical protein